MIERQLFPYKKIRENSETPLGSRYVDLKNRSKAYIVDLFIVTFTFQIFKQDHNSHNHQRKK